MASVGIEQTTYSGNYGLWQYSWKVSINGISGGVDLDYAYKDYPSIIKNAGLNGMTSTETSAVTVENGETDADVKTTAETSDVLEKILEHVASIDGKL